MASLVTKLGRLAQRIARGEVDVIVEKLRDLYWYDKRFYILRRDLEREFEPPRSPVRFTVREYRDGDFDALFDAASREEQREREARERWMRHGLGTCYVAVLEDGRPCFTQWLLTPWDNDRIRRVFKDLIPQLPPDTVLVKAAYTPPKLRRLPVMPAAMAQIAELARETGARWIIVPVGDDVPSMLKAAQWAGFEPWQLKCDRRRLFHSVVTYTESPPLETPRPTSMRRQPA